MKEVGSEVVVQPKGRLVQHCFSVCTLEPRKDHRSERFEKKDLRKVEERGNWPSRLKNLF